MKQALINGLRVLYKSCQNNFRYLFGHLLDLIFPVVAQKRVGYEINLEKLFIENSCSLSKAENEITFKEIHSILEYSHKAVKKLVVGAKYYNNKKAARTLACLLYSVIVEVAYEKIEWCGASLPMIIIPMPTSKERIRERGYNQCERLVTEVLRYANLSNTSYGWLRADFKSFAKIKYTESQTKQKNRSERRKNIAGSFSVLNTENIAGKDVILIDDVTTTGSTIEEAMRVLFSAKARSVTALTVAKQTRIGVAHARKI